MPTIAASQSGRVIPGRPRAAAAGKTAVKTKAKGLNLLDFFGAPKSIQRKEVAQGQELQPRSEAAPVVEPAAPVLSVEEQSMEKSNDNHKPQGKQQHGKHKSVLSKPKYSIGTRIKKVIVTTHLRECDPRRHVLLTSSLPCLYIPLVLHG